MVFMQAPPELPTSVTVQMILDPVQAKYPGNEWVKPCGPTNIMDACYDPLKPHLVYHVYMHKENCEKDEDVSCVELGDSHAMWVPIGKPVVVDESDPPEQNKEAR